MQDNVRAVFKESIAGISRVSQSTWGDAQSESLAELGRARDPRVVWLISDLMRFTWQPELSDELSSAASALLGTEFTSDDHWPKSLIT